MLIVSKVSKIGDSLGVLIPQNEADLHRVHANDEVIVLHSQKHRTGKFVLLSGNDILARGDSFEEVIQEASKKLGLLVRTIKA